MKWLFTLYNGYTTEEIDQPIGWMEAVFTIKRDETWHGIFFEYSIPLKFHGSGYQYIKDQYEVSGVEADVIIDIFLQCGDQDEYELMYSGKLNFTKLEFLLSDQCLVSIPIEPENCLMTFRNRIDQKVDLEAANSFDQITALAPYDNIAETIFLEPKAIFKKTDSELSADCEANNTETFHMGAGSDCVDILFTSFFQFGFDQVDLNELEFFNNITCASVLSGAVAPIFTCSDPGEYTLDYFFAVRVSIDVDTDTNDACGTCITTNPLNVQNVIVTLFISVNLVTVYSETAVNQSWCNVTFDQQFIFNNPIELTLNAGDAVRIYVYVEHQGEWSERLVPESDVTTIVDFTIGVGSYFKMTALVFEPASACEVSLINEALSRTAEVITDDCLRVYSDYFGRTDAQPYVSAADGCGSLECTTTGLHIRQYPLARQNISFKDLWEGLNAIHNIGIGLEDDPNRPGYQWLRIELMEWFYDTTLIMTCDKVPDIQRKVIYEEHISKIIIGYPKWEFEEYTGLDEFNTKREYRTSLTTIRNTLTLLSHFITSGYAIEVTRNKIWSGTTQDDSRYDNDDFLICVDRGGYGYLGLSVEQGNITSPLNLIHPDSVYNYRISPLRNLMRWMKKIMASYADPTAGQLYFTSGDGNVIAEGQIIDSCALENSVITENESPMNSTKFLDTGDFNPIYKLELWSFDYPMSLQEYKDVRANPKGVINVRYGQQEDFVSCWIRNIEYKPNDGIATFNLLPNFLLEDIATGGETFYILLETGDYYLQEDDVSKFYLEEAP